MQIELTVNQDMDSLGDFTDTLIQDRLAPPRQPNRVMVVDDEAMVTTSVCMLLNLHSEFDAQGFNSPEEALKAIESGHFVPDVVVSDFLMPEMNGIEFLHAVEQRCPYSTRILLTGYADKENAIEAINKASIYRYLEKPWDNDALLMTLKNAVERTDLLHRLNDKVNALEMAQEELRQYSALLEERVTEKTRDLTSAHNKLKAIVENTGDAIVTVSSEGIMQDLNPTFVEWCGRATDALIAHPVASVLTFNDDTAAEVLRLATQSMIREGHLGNRLVEVNISPLTTGEGVVMVCRDIAKRKEAERLREDFVSTLTHDLRTPLMAAKQTLGFFLDGTLGDISQEQRDIIMMMIDSNEQMLELVNVLLEVYRYEAKQQRLIMDDIQLADIIQQVMMELQGLVKTKEQTLETTILEPLPVVMGDKHAIRRVLTNLVANAHHYTGHGTRIIVDVDVTPTSVIVSVKDNGRGIPKADLEQLFQRFAQGTSKHRNTGTGLGLYLCRQILDAHGGRIWVDSEEGKGSTFSFELMQPIPGAVGDLAKRESRQLGLS